MRRWWQISGLFCLSTGVLYANGIIGCTLNSQSLSLNQCYSANTFFSNPLTVDWGTAFGQANAPSLNPQNQSAAPWTTTIAGVTVGVSVGSDYSGTGTPSLMRVNNEVYVWNGSSWVFPGFLPTSNPNHADFTYDGHFNAPGPTGVAGDGAHLLTLNGNNVTGSFVINLSQGATAAGLRLSSVGFGFNQDFGATIRAYDNASNLLATYHIDTQGVGAECATIGNNPPTPCNDAPFIGIKAPGPLSSQLIYKLVISANNSAGGAQGLFMDSFQFDEVPEPGVIVLCGTGLALIGFWRRRVAAGPSKS